MFDFELVAEIALFVEIGGQGGNTIKLSRFGLKMPNSRREIGPKSPTTFEGLARISYHATRGPKLVILWLFKVEMPNFRALVAW